MYACPASSAPAGRRKDATYWLHGYRCGYSTFACICYTLVSVYTCTRFHGYQDMAGIRILLMVCTTKDTDARAPAPPRRLTTLTQAASVSKRLYGVQTLCLNTSSERCSKQLNTSLERCSTQRLNTSLERCSTQRLNTSLARPPEVFRRLNTTFQRFPYVRPRKAQRPKFLKGAARHLCMADARRLLQLHTGHSASLQVHLDLTWTCPLCARNTRMEWIGSLHCLQICAPMLERIGSLHAAHLLASFSRVGSDIVVGQGRARQRGLVPPPGLVCDSRRAFVIT